MNVTQQLAHSVLGEPHLILGLPMRPLCVGHWLLLHRHKIAFVTGENPSLEDLLLGLLICSQPYRDFERTGTDPRKLERAVRTWQHRLSGGLRGRITRSWHRLRGQLVHPHEVLGANLAEAAAQFSAYLLAHGALDYYHAHVDQWAFPLTRSNLDANQCTRLEVGAPEPMRVLVGAMVEMGMSFEEAAELPLPWLRWLLATAEERAGRITILDRDEHARDLAESEAEVLIVEEAKS